VHLRAALVTAALITVVGCQASTSRTPAATAPHGIDGLVADLVTARTDPKSGTAFTSEPIGGQGSTVCLGTETVRAYEFIDHEAALAASQTIDRDDPSRVGNGIVDWAGAPRFWLRDRVIVLYLGEDAEIEATLRTLLGPPFAQGQAGRMPLPEPPCR
jgi:hypothetical protein